MMTKLKAQKILELESRLQYIYKEQNLWGFRLWHYNEEWDNSVKSAELFMAGYEAKVNENNNA